MQCPGREFHGRWAASPQPWTMKGWMWVSTVQEGEVNGLSQKWPLGAYVTWLYCGGKKPNIYSAQIEGTDKWKKKSIRGPPVKPPPLPPSSPFSSHLLLLTRLPLTSSSFRLLLLLTFLLYPLSLPLLHYKPQNWWRDAAWASLTSLQLCLANLLAFVACQWSLGPKEGKSCHTQIIK